MYAPLARSDYYRASAPPRAFNRRRIYPVNPHGFGATGTMRDGSRVHREPIDQLGTQLCPGSIANGYAADLHRGLPTGTLSRLRSRPSTPDGRALHPGPYPPDLSRCLAYGALNTGSSRIPSDPARRTQPVWQYQAVPALSALLPALPDVSRIGLRSAPTRLLRQPGGKDSHLPWFIGASRRTSASCRRHVKTGSGPLCVIESTPFAGQAAWRMRLRSRSKLARPYICLLIILMRLTLPSTAPELCGIVSPLRTAS
jgi:hypothetical protein